MLTTVNLACNEALLARKKNFVVALIKRGATPPPPQLQQVEGLMNEPCVMKYLKSVISPKEAVTPWGAPEEYYDDEVSMSDSLLSQIGTIIYGTYTQYLLPGLEYMY
jgi:hypothetical protein